MANAHIRAFFDEPTNTVSYLVWDPDTAKGAVIAPVLDFDVASGEADVRSAEAILAAAGEEGVTVDWVLETHAHADHLSAAPFIKAKTGAAIGIGARIRDVQKIFRPIFGMDDLKTDGSDFDTLFEDGDTFSIGSLSVEVLHVPGHTPADIAYKVGDAVFVGDTLFMPDFGTGGFPRRRRAPALPLDPPPAGAARRYAAVHVSRLQGAGARRLCVGNHRRRAEAQQCARARRRERGRVRGDARGARQRPCRATPAAPVHPGQHPRRALPRSGRQRRRLPAHPGQPGAPAPGRLLSAAVQLPPPAARPALRRCPPQWSAPRHRATRRDRAGARRGSSRPAAGRTRSRCRAA